MAGKKSDNPKARLNELLSNYIHIIKSCKARPDCGAGSHAQAETGLALLTAIQAYINSDYNVFGVRGLTVKLGPLLKQFNDQPIKDNAGFAIALAASTFLQSLLNESALMAQFSTEIAVKKAIWSTVNDINKRKEEYEKSLAFNSSHSVSFSDHAYAAGVGLSAHDTSDQSTITASAIEKNSVDNGDVENTAEASSKLEVEQVKELAAKFLLDQINNQIGNIKAYQITFGGKVVDNMRLPTNLAAIYRILQSNNSDSKKLGDIRGVLNSISSSWSRTSKTEKLYNDLKTITSQASFYGNAMAFQSALAQSKPAAPSDRFEPEN